MFVGPVCGTSFTMEIISVYHYSAQLYLKSPERQLDHTAKPTERNLAKKNKTLLVHLVLREFAMCRCLRSEL